jgi:CheY-like chemotaxis protein
MGRDSLMLSGLIILIVESEPISRNTLMDILETAGADLQFEERMQDSLAVFRTFIPDCILCNVSLPDGSGYTLIEHLRKLETDIGITQTPAIAVFDSDKLVDTEHSLKSGFQAVASKPWKPREIINAVLQVTGRKRSGGRH